MKKIVTYSLLFFSLLIYICSCKSKDGIGNKMDLDNTKSLNPANRFFCMINSEEGWNSSFCGMKENDEKLKLTAEHAKIPVQGSNSNGIMMKYENTRNNLFMYISKKFSKLEDLKANTKYKIRLSFYIATNQKDDRRRSSQKVYIKAGATNIEPNNYIDKGLKLINLDKGNLARGGEDIKILGEATKEKNEKDDSFQFKSFDTLLDVITNDKGEAWIVLGADCGVDGTCTMYFTDVRVIFFDIKK